MRQKITGLMIYYYFVCQRKLWYFLHQITMEQTCEAVSVGKQLDQYSYEREWKHLNINDEITIDYLSDRRIVHEIKKSRKIEEAAIWQVKYYLYYLRQRGVSDLSGQIDYPLLRQSLAVELTDADCNRLAQVEDEIISCAKQAIPPTQRATGICSRCAYHDLCLI